MPLLERHGLKIVVANGETIRSRGLCPSVPLLFNQFSFHFDLFVLPLDNFDVVLGVNWLKTLGAIVWDFDNMTMTFTF